jgi:UDP-N-acetylmuramate--alanine ligase
MIFQPHRYSRTAEHFSQFVDILKNVNNLILMDVYAANEVAIDNISSEVLLDEIRKYNENVKLINDHKKLEKYVNQKVNDNDILLTMGAGDISKFKNYYKNSLE